MNPFLNTTKVRLAYALKEYAFRSKIRTSRGSLEQKASWFVLLFEEGKMEHGGLGEISPLPGLSLETGEAIEQQLETVRRELDAGMMPDWDSLSSSVRFGLESALADMQNGGTSHLFPSEFTAGSFNLTINGLVWMADLDSMLKEAEAKLAQGFRCIKFKIGHFDWPSERRLIELLRERYSLAELEIRVDANGAYTYEAARPVLDDLAKLQVHSIEQPLPVEDEFNLKKLMGESQVAIALDEQLIALQNIENETAFLLDWMPHYLVMKPTLIGGLGKTRRWIAAAERQGIGWWITSSLETPIALNALAQFTAQFRPELPQGLSTGKIYREEFDVPIHTDGPSMRFHPDRTPKSYDLFRRLIGY